MKKELVKFKSLDKALEHIKKHSKSSKIFTNSAKEILEWYGIDWQESVQKPESTIRILNAGEHSETDVQLEVREIMDNIARDVLNHPDDNALWLAEVLQKHYRTYLKHMGHITTLDNKS